MNVIEFLVQDHDQLRRELVDIKKNLTLTDLRDKTEHLVSHFEMHECVEEEILFPSLEGLENCFLERYEKIHSEIWDILEQFRNLTRLHKLQMLKQSFFTLDYFAEEHFSNEERLLFPTIEKAMNTETLERLGERAERFFRKFSESLVTPVTL